ncbi:Molybdenum_cofactor sulfurase [Hexamita inflata]|uniref:Molybdenum cofactor sulfurase n=1 Tax=Hexamita inflata TaxID=28002 RepID=A0AA86QEL1_9EUKA|nr:Molybdenum cofactor sulfurase [Hexamita inflata]
MQQQPQSISHRAEVQEREQNPVNKENAKFIKYLVISGILCCIAFAFDLFQYNFRSSSNQYHMKVQQMRTQQFPHLNRSIYLDSTGAALYQKQQVDNYHRYLSTNFLCNPHSNSECSKNSDKVIEEARQRVLKFFNTTDIDYHVVFTKSATHGVHILSDILPINNDSILYLARQSHNSLVGLRNVYPKMTLLPFNITDIKVEREQKLNYSEMIKRNKNFTRQDTFDLVAFPAKDNFVGDMIPLEIINSINQDDSVASILQNAEKRDSHVLTLLDAAAFVPSNRLNLSVHKPNFVILSCYKIFGFPTSVGVLLVRADTTRLLEKRYFGGGSTITVGVESNFTGYKKNCTKFEDGTLDYLSIASISQGFDLIDDLGLENIQSHLHDLSAYLHSKLSNLTHSNKIPLVKLYSTNFNGIVTFNLINKNNITLGYSSITRRLAEKNINVRGGCACTVMGGGIAFSCLLCEQLYIKIFCHFQCG